MKLLCNSYKHLELLNRGGQVSTVAGHNGANYQQALPHFLLREAQKQARFTVFFVFKAAYMLLLLFGTRTPT